jgi:hypothetical protein
MSFFNGLIIAKEQAFGAKARVPMASTVMVGDAWGKPAKMAMPKRKWMLIKQFLEAEVSE